MNIINKMSLWAMSLCLSSFALEEANNFVSANEIHLLDVEGLELPRMTRLMLRRYNDALGVPSEDKVNNFSLKKTNEKQTRNRASKSTPEVNTNKKRRVSQKLRKKARAEENSFDQTQEDNKSRNLNVNLHERDSELDASNTAVSYNYDDEKAIAEFLAYNMEPHIAKSSVHSSRSDSPNFTLPPIREYISGTIPSEVELTPKVIGRSETLFSSFSAYISNVNQPEQGAPQLSVEQEPVFEEASKASQPEQGAPQLSVEQEPESVVSNALGVPSVRTEQLPPNVTPAEIEVAINKFMTIESYRKNTKLFEKDMIRSFIYAVLNFDTAFSNNPKYGKIEKGKMENVLFKRLQSDLTLDDASMARLLKRFKELDSKISMFPEKIGLMEKISNRLLKKQQRANLENYNVKPSRRLLNQREKMIKEINGYYASIPENEKISTSDLYVKIRETHKDANNLTLILRQFVNNKHIAEDNYKEVGAVLDNVK